MKYLSILVLSLVIIPFSAKAQWGVTAGFNTSRSTDIDAVDYSFGLQVATHYNLALGKNFSYKPQFILSNERLTKKTGSADNSGIYGITSLNRQEVRQNAYYATLVPVDIAYQFNIKKSKLMIDAGFYTAIGMFGQSNYETWIKDNYWKAPSTETFPTRDRFDYGLTFGLSFIHKNIITSIQAKYGLKSIDPIGKGKLETYMFSVGYQF